LRAKIFRRHRFYCYRAQHPARPTSPPALSADKVAPRPSKEIKDSNETYVCTRIFIHCYLFDFLFGVNSPTVKAGDLSGYRGDWTFFVSRYTLLFAIPDIVTVGNIAGTARIVCGTRFMKTARRPSVRLSVYRFHSPAAASFRRV